MPATQTHTITIVTQANHGTKARRFSCSCGEIGPRIAYGPGIRTIQQATVRAEQSAAKYHAH